MELPPITSTQNRLVGQVRRYLAKPRECRRDGVLVADGIHLVQEALKARLRCRALYFSTTERDPEVEAIRADALQRRLPVYEALPHVFRNLSPVETPQGVVGVFHRPTADRSRVWGNGSALKGHLAIADGIQDPTNIGALARSALAAGIAAMITTPGTVDPFHHRALRAAQGASFHLPHLVEEPVGPLIARLRNIGYLLVGLSGRGDTDLQALDPHRPMALLLGSEGAGLGEEVLAAVDVRARIPIRAEVESLGVAAAGAVAFFWLHLAGRNGHPPA